MLRAKFTTVEIGPISSVQLVNNLVPTGLPTSKVYKVRNLFCDCTHGGFTWFHGRHLGKFLSSSAKRARFLI